MSHFAFVDPGGASQPDYVKAAHYAVTRLYWQANDEQLTRPIIDAVGTRKIGAGLLRDPIWGHLSRLDYEEALRAGKPPAPLGAIDLARTLDADLVTLGFGFGTAPNSCAVLADIEYHDPAYVIAFLHEWRQLRPKRITGWTLEPLQGGWITKDLAAMLLSSQVTVFPQTYRGDMSIVNYDLVRSQLIEAGIPRGMVGLVYKATAVAASWDGIAFPFHELP
jgi:hypothetical protein